MSIYLYRASRPRKVTFDSEFGTEYNQLFSLKKDYTPTRILCDKYGQFGRRDDDRISRLKKLFSRFFCFLY